MLWQIAPCCIEWRRSQINHPLPCRLAAQENVAILQLKKRLQHSSGLATKRIMSEHHRQIKIFGQRFKNIFINTALQIDAADFCPHGVGRHQRNGLQSHEQFVVAINIGLRSGKNQQAAATFHITPQLAGQSAGDLLYAVKNDQVLVIKSCIIQIICFGIGKYKGGVAGKKCIQKDVFIGFIYYQNRNFVADGKGKIKCVVEGDG